MTAAQARLAVDIGGTFTDVVLEHGDRQITNKVLTTPDAPERGVLDGITKAMAEAGLSPADVGLLIHGTTLATNALIERKGAKTALITTEGHRDAVEMALENRFEQYDINIDRPQPLVPRYLRWPVTERLNVQGKALLPLELASVDALLPLIEKHGIEALAIGLLHAYANPAHEQAVAERIQAAYPSLAISLSSEVAPEIREYERQSTTCANAYVQPKMSRYLTALDEQLKAQGFGCPFLLMTSGGGLTDLATAVKFPIRLVESGPAGGAILAARIAEELGLDRVLSYDMGGTTAKICLIDDYKPLSTRTFEVARAYRNLKGSGLPVKIPAIEMVEIGAGGGSIASVDALGRVAVGPESAGSQPGPACYDQGGTRAAVTDADLVLGKIDPAAFAGGSVKLAPEKSAQVLEATVGKPLGMDASLAAFAVAEIVDENMANAARVHAVEWGKDVAGRAMIAFGGAAPLHAARLAEKLNIAQVIVPAGAGVGSAVGFLRAPISYEVVRSRYMRLDQFDAAAVNALLGGMKAEAESIVRQGAPTGDLSEVRFAFMRYVGQGHEITVELPARALADGDAATLREAFEETYRALYGQTVPGQQPEILTWTLTVASEAVSSAVAVSDPASTPAGEPVGTRRLFDSAAQAFVEAQVWRRETMGAAEVAGPALIVEDQTTTVVPDGFTARMGKGGALVLTRG